jgi:2-polyprenyl-6-methoxyphenol hydroxylase-like FAD-dependent oxidoreductase
MRVLIIGGGIGGLTAAIALRRRGIECEVYERATALAEVGAGISLWPNALKALDQLGLKGRLDALSFVAETGALRSADGAVLSRTSAREFVSRFGGGVTVFHRAELLDALLTAASGIPIHLSQELKNFVEDGREVTIEFTNGARARGDLLVGADGLRSTVRSRLGIPGALRYSGYTAWRGIAPFATADLIAGETLGCGRRFGLVPIIGNRVYWYAADNVVEGEYEPEASAKARLTRMFERWHPPIPAVIAATEAAMILRNDIFDRDPVGRWGAGRVTLLGDAAHPMTPNLGQGACQAIEDALVLARSIAEDGSERSLRRYEAARIPRTSSIVKASRRIGRLMQIQTPALCRARNLALRMTPPAISYRSLAGVIGYEDHLEERLLP